MFQQQSKARASRLSRLLDKEENGTLTSDEGVELDILIEEGAGFYTIHTSGDMGEDIL